MSRADSPILKLPLDDAIRLAYASYFRQFAEVLRASSLWLIIVGFVTGLVNWLQWSWMANTGLSNDPGVLRSFLPGNLWALNHLSQLVLLLAGSSIAVAWHRRLLRNERPGCSGCNIATPELWRYLIIVVALLAIAPVLPYVADALLIYLFGPRLNIHSDSFVLVLLFFVVLFIAGVIVALRLVLLLPASAAGKTRLTFRQAWLRTGGNTWRLFGGLFMTIFLPILIAKIVYGWMLAPTALNIHAGGTAIRMTAIDVALSAFYLLLLPLGAGFLSFAYRHLVEGIDIANERSGPLTPPVIPKWPERPGPKPV